MSAPKNEKGGPGFARAALGDVAIVPGQPGVDLRARRGWQSALHASKLGRISTLPRLTQLLRWRAGRIASIDGALATLRDVEHHGKLGQCPKQRSTVCRWRRQRMLLRGFASDRRVVLIAIEIAIGIGRYLV
jgi:hypothetical protein